MSLYVLDTDQGMITGLALLDVQGSKLDQVGQCLEVQICVESAKGYLNWPRGKIHRSLYRRVSWIAHDKTS